MEVDEKQWEAHRSGRRPCGEHRLVEGGGRFGRGRNLGRFRRVIETWTAIKKRFVESISTDYLVLKKKLPQVSPVVFFRVIT